MIVRYTIVRVVPSLASKGPSTLSKQVLLKRPIHRFHKGETSPWVASPTTAAGESEKWALAMNGGHWASIDLVGWATDRCHLEKEHLIELQVVALVIRNHTANVTGQYAFSCGGEESLCKSIYLGCCTGSAPVPVSYLSLVRANGLHNNSKVCKQTKQTGAHYAVQSP